MAYKQLKLWFDGNLAKMLAKKINTIYPDFKSKRFVSQVVKQVDELELKDRIELIADLLFSEFGKDYKKGIKILGSILGPENTEETGMFVNFYWLMPIAKLVEKYGLDDFAMSMHALEEITKRNTSEYAIRPYLEQNTKKTLTQMLKWSKSKNAHVRRLASEGLRPRLPWAKKLDVFIENPKLIFPILENLKDDPSKYVQKSVANCLNDILKDNYSVGKSLMNAWHGSKISKERKWIIKHALRNLIKTKDPWAMKLIT